MKAESFEILQTVLKKRSGLVVSPDNAYLLESRLMPVARRWNVKGLDELVALVRKDGDERLLTNITEAMVTNESSFFRDGRPFRQFKSLVLPSLLERRAAEKHIRIWCAASSTGQEPYSLAMILREERSRLQDWTVEIVGSDISTELLEKAKAGLYTQFEVQRGLPIVYLVKYFTQIGDKWELSDDVRRMVTFQSFNLLNDPSPLGRFDVVFCRNVLSYFERTDMARTLDQVSGQMPADGVLYLGGGESVFGITESFTPIDGHRDLFRPQSGAAGAGQPAAAAAG